MTIPEFLFLLFFFVFFSVANLFASEIGYRFAKLWVLKSWRRR